MDKLLQEIVELRQENLEFKLSLTSKELKKLELLELEIVKLQNN
jgi:hypothetical protein